jgi:OOP family OmpA-OmpF porin
MNKKFRDTEKSKYDMLKSEMLARNSYLPDLGFTGGIYLYTPWKVILPMQPFNRDAFAAAMDNLPEEAYGPTFLADGLANLDPILAKLSGRTAVFLFSDGSHYNPEGNVSPQERIRELAGKYDVCVTIVSSAEGDAEIRLLGELAAVNECSRVIPFDKYIDRPEYNSGALLVVNSTAEVVTLTEQKIVGLKTDPVYFGFNVDRVDPVFAKGLKEIADFMNNNPSAYLVIDGYADSVGSSEYNLKLSRCRAETVANHMTKDLGVDPDRLVVLWQGEVNPIASNDNAEGPEPQPEGGNGRRRD